MLSGLVALLKLLLNLFGRGWFSGLVFFFFFFFWGGGGGGRFFLFFICFFYTKNKFNISLYELMFFQFGKMLDTTTLYILIPF